MLDFYLIDGGRPELEEGLPVRWPLGVRLENADPEVPHHLLLGRCPPP